MLIKNIKYEKSAVIIIVEDDNEKIKFQISLDDYIEGKYKVNNILDEMQLEQLQKAHRYYYCYKKCISKLQHKDYSIKEIRDYLNEYIDLTDKEKEEVIDKLKKQGFLEDRMTAESQLYCDQIKLVGKKKSAFKMKKRGIESQVIEEVLGKINLNEEKERGIKKASQLFNSTKNKSYKETIFCIKNKLKEEGFENIDDILNDLAIEYDEQKEESALRYQFAKIKRMYSKKYKGKALYNAYYKYLLSKGFENELIARNLAKENEDEDQ